MKRKALDRAVRETQIVTTFATHIQKGLPNKMTAYGIARALDLTPCNHLYDILRGMVASGKLDTFSRPNSGRWATWYYALPEGTYTPPKKTHDAIIKAKGKVVGQLELFS